MTSIDWEKMAGNDVDRGRGLLSSMDDQYVQIAMATKFYMTTNGPSL